MIASEELLLGIIERSGKLPRPMRKVLTTFLLLANPADYVQVLVRFREAILRGSLSPDPRLMLQLYRALPRHLKIQLVDSAVAPALDARTFRILFEDAFFRQQPNRSERAALANAFSLFFSLHPKIGSGGMDDLIRFLLRSREEALRLHGLLVVECLETISESDLRLVARCVRLRTRGWSNNAWVALIELAKRPGVLKPPLVAELRELAKRKASKPGRGEPHNARVFLRVTEPSGGKRKRRGNPSASLGVIG